jgi:hypothetical protein
MTCRAFRDHDPLLFQAVGRHSTSSCNTSVFANPYVKHSLGQMPHNGATKYKLILSFPESGERWLLGGIGKDAVFLGLSF